MRTDPGRINETLQKTLLWAYGQVRDSNWMERPWAQRTFLSLYSLYKRHFEDPFAILLRDYPLILRGGSVLDIGANIGYTAMLFSRQLGDGFRVYAFEPEARNLRILRNAIQRHGLENRITVIPMAVGARSDSVELWINPDTHADHRILTDTFRSVTATRTVQKIAMTSIDDFMARHPEASPLAFIKIDVQGFEEPAARGMTRTLAQNPEAVVAVEYFPVGITSLGFRPEGVLDYFEKKGYFAHHLSRQQGLVRVQSADLRGDLPPPGYVDLVYARRPLTQASSS